MGTTSLDVIRLNSSDPSVQRFLERHLVRLPKPRSEYNNIHTSGRLQVAIKQLLAK